MDYTILKTDLLIWDGGRRAKLRAGLEEAVKGWRELYNREDEYDGYDYREDYGFYTGDDQKAYFHGCFAIEQLLYEKEKLSDRDYQSWKQSLLQDTRNYYRCRFIWNRDHGKRELKMLFQALLYFQMGREIIKTVNAHFDSCKKDWEKEDTIEPFLDFNQWYEWAGDMALFEDQDPELALEFYRLSELQWEFGGTGQHYRENDWKKYGEIFCGKMPRPQRKSELYKEPGADLFEANLFNQIWNAACKMAPPGTLAELGNRFLCQLQQWEERYGKREAAFMAHRIRKICGPSAIYCLEKEKREIQKRWAQPVTEGILRGYFEGTEPLASWLASEPSQNPEPEQSLTIIFQYIKIIIGSAHIRYQLLEREMDQELAYYTSLNTFSYLLPNKDKDAKEWARFSIMHMAYMNDPNEGKMLLRFLKADQEPGGPYQRKPAEYPYVFMKCFTSLIDDLPMWEMYGDRAEGCCIVLDPKCFRNNQKEALPLYRICYIRKNKNYMTVNQNDNPFIDGKKLKEIKDWLKEIRDAFEKTKADPAVYRLLTEGLGEIRYLFKDADYCHEQEVRILYLFPGQDDSFCHTGGQFPMLFISPDFPVSMKEVITGPKFPELAKRMPYLKEQLEILCRAKGMDMPRLTMSAIEYK